MTRKGEELITFTYRYFSDDTSNIEISRDILHEKLYHEKMPQTNHTPADETLAEVRNLNKILIDSELQKQAYRIQFGFYNIKSVCLDTHYVLANLKTILHEYNVCSM